MKILLVCWRATLSPGPTPPSAGFQVSLLRWVVPARAASESFGDFFFDLRDQLVARV